MPEIWGIILAAGRSTRMGEPKMLLPFGGKTIIGNVIDSARNSSLDGVIVVTGAYKEDITSEAVSSGVSYCHNEDFDRGMLTSVWEGLKSLPPSCTAAVILLGDQPFISPALIDLLADCHRHAGKGLIVPVFKGKKGHPVLIDLHYMDDIYNLDPSQGLKGLFLAKKSYIYEIKVDTNDILRDIDNREDYNRELKQII